MAAILEKIAKLAIPAGLLVGGVQSAMYDGKQNTNSQKCLTTDSNGCVHL